MSNLFEHRRPTELEDKAHADAVRHFSEHLKQFPASREAVDRLERDLAKIGPGSEHGGIQADANRGLHPGRRWHAVAQER